MMSPASPRPPRVPFNRVKSQRHLSQSPLLSPSKGLFSARPRSALRMSAAPPSPSPSQDKTPKPPAPPPDELHAAIRGGDADAVRAQLAIHVNVEAPFDSFNDGRTSLALAAAFGRVAIMRTLLSAGAKLDAACNEGLTPLMWAVLKGSKNCIKLLVDAGASLRAIDKQGRTALMVAASKQSSTVCLDALLEAGAHKEARSRDGRSALVYAATHGSLGAVKALIEAGADKEARSRDGRTALAWAAAYHHTPCVRALVEAGAEQQSASQESAEEVARKIEKMCLDLKPPPAAQGFRKTDNKITDRWMYPGPWQGQYC